MKIEYDRIDYQGEETFHYKLTKKVIFCTGYPLGEWDLYSPDGQLMVQCRASIVVVYPGYMWDGSTVIGEYYEDEQTMEASLLHDVLYNAYKNPQDIEVPFNLFLADKIMMRHLLKLYKGQGFVKSWLFPHLYYWGLTTVGIPWKFGNNDYYTLQKKEE